MVVNSGLCGLLEFCLTWWYPEVFLQVFFLHLCNVKQRLRVAYLHRLWNICQFSRHSFQLLLDWLVKAKCDCAGLLLTLLWEALKTHLQKISSSVRFFLVTFLSLTQCHECILYNFIMGGPTGNWTPHPVNITAQWVTSKWTDGLLWLYSALLISRR